MYMTKLNCVLGFILVGTLTLLGCTSPPETRLVPDATQVMQTSVANAVEQTPVAFIPTPTVTSSDNRSPIIDMAFSLDNNLIALATACGDVALFGLQKEPLGLLRLDQTIQDTYIQFGGPIRMMAFTADSKSLVLSGKDGTLAETCFETTDDLRWDIRKNMVSSWGFASGTYVAAGGFAFPDGVNFMIVPNSDSASISNRSDGYAYVWEMGTTEAMMNLGYEELNAIDATTTFSPDATIKAVASGHDIILERTIDNQTWHILQGSRGGHQSQVTAIMFSRDGNTFFSASEDGQIIIWAIGLAIRQYFPDSPPEDFPLIWNQLSVDPGISSLELNFDQSVLAIGFDNSTISVASVTGLNRP